MQLKLKVISRVNKHASSFCQKIWKKIPSSVVFSYFVFLVIHLIDIVWPVVY